MSLHASFTENGMNGIASVEIFQSGKWHLLPLSLIHPTFGCACCLIYALASPPPKNYETILPFR